MIWKIITSLIVIIAIVYILNVSGLTGRFLSVLGGAEITRVDGDYRFQGFNYVFVVTCGVKNNGIFLVNPKITSEFSGQGQYLKQTKQISIENGEYKEVQFVFDISFWKGIFDTSQVRYNCQL